jgi:hypothetical protein
MFEQLDRIPWDRLHHAYGPATDVPDLLRQLRTAPRDLSGEQSPLWHLFGNIWHQGTVFEATAYAVPFLIELAAGQQVPDRTGILHLLSAVATGRSYLDRHGHLLRKPEPDFAERKARELEWVEAAHAAVARGVAVFLAITREETEVRLAAAHVLALLPKHREIACVRLRSMLAEEEQSLQRAGLLLLLGLVRDRSDATSVRLMEACSSGDRAQRHGVAFALAHIAPDPLPALARTAILEAIAADDLERSFGGLPWDPGHEIDRHTLYAALDPASRDEAATTAILAVEGGDVSSQRVSTVLELLFPIRPPRDKPPLTAEELSPLQRRAVLALAKVWDGSSRIFAGYFPRWGLPHTQEDWRALASAAGRPTTS